MMLDCLAALTVDETTDVIVLVSKPPAPAWPTKSSPCQDLSETVVVCFLGGKTGAGGLISPLPRKAAKAAVALAKGEKPQPPSCSHEKLATMAAVAKAKLAPEQKGIRGLFSGGTLCEEAARLTADDRHIFLDLGDDAYTKGKPHPMIEPSLRLPYILEAARDPAVAVILLDVVLGYGSHPDPAGVTALAIAEAKAIARAAGRHLEIIAYVCGTDADPQGKADQESKLAAAGAMLAKSNVRGAYLAAAIVSEEV
jgi:succinyl-CoA synthetase alpha subunit